MSDIPSTGKLVINVHDSKLYKAVMSVREKIEQMKVHMPGPMYEELTKEFNKLDSEAELLSTNHSLFFGLSKQCYQLIIDSGLEEGIPRDDDKVILFKSQVHNIEVMIKTLATLGTFYNKK